MPISRRCIGAHRLILVPIALALFLPADGVADDADLLLLQHGHQAWISTSELLVERKEFIQGDLAVAARSPDWRVRTFAEVIRLQSMEPQVFADESARITNFLHMYLSAIGKQAGPVPADQTTFTQIGRSNESQLPYPLIKPPKHFPPQHIPWPVLAHAMLTGNEIQRSMANLIFWSEPRLELIGPAWRCNAYRHADEWLLEEAILALGPAAIPFLQEQLHAGTPNRPALHRGMASRLLAALGDPTCLAEFRKRLRLPPPPMLSDQENRGTMWLDEDALAGLEVLAKAQDPESLPLLIDRFADYLINGRDASFDNSSGRKSTGADFPDDPASRVHPSQRCHVDRMAEALAYYGPTVVPLLEATLKSWSADAVAGSNRTMSIATMQAHIGWLQANTDGERRIAAMRWNLARQWDPHLLLELRRITGESLAPYVLRNGLIAKGAYIGDFNQLRERQLDALRILATSGDVTLVPIIDDWIRSHRQRYAMKTAELESERGPGTVDAQLLREQAGAMLADNSVTANLLAVDEGLLALIRIGGPTAITALRTTLADKPWSALAEAGIMLLEDRRDELVRRVNDKDSQIAEAAAQALWIAKSIAAQPGLIAGAARRRGENHHLWLERAAELGPLAPAVDAIPAAARSDLRLRTLCAAILTEAADPTAATQARRVMLDAANQVSRMHVWGTGLIVGTARNLVKPNTATTEPQLTLVARPLLEAECLFGSGVIRRGIAANALAALGDERSIPIIAASADMGAPGGSNPVVPALEAFGPRAAAQAAAVPRLIPAQADTGLSVTNHRYSTQVLADLGDIRAVEQILEGLKTSAADRNLNDWDHRVHVYLQAAEKCTDDRLLESLLDIAQESRHEYLAKMALLQLGRYADPRGEALLMNAFAAGCKKEGIARNDTLNMYVTQALIDRWGPAALDRLLALTQSGNPRRRGMACYALADLSEKNRFESVYHLKWPIPFPARDNAADRTRELTLPILIAALRDPDLTTQGMAADAMTTFIGGEDEQALEIQGKRTITRPAVVGDRRGIPALTAWLKAGNEPDYLIVGCLAREGDQAAGQAMLGSLARGRSWLNTNCSDGILRAIGRLQPPGAIAALEQIAMELPISRYDRCSFSALDGLALHGSAGMESLNRLQRIITTHRMRAYIADLLSKSRALDIKLTRQQLDACFSDTDAVEFNDNSSAEQAKNAREGTCITFLRALTRCDSEAARLASASLLRSGSDDLIHMTLQTLACGKMYHSK